MSVIAKTSNALIAKIKAHFKGRLNKVAEHSGQWDEQTIRQIVIPCGVCSVARASA